MQMLLSESGPPLPRQFGSEGKGRSRRRDRLRPTTETGSRPGESVTVRCSRDGAAATVGDHICAVPEPEPPPWERRRR